MSDQPLQNIGRVGLPEAPDINVAALFGSSAPFMSDARSDDELAVLNVVRLVNRSAVSPGVSIVERAFLMGAKAMFEQLASTCQQLLDENELHDQDAPTPRALAVPNQEPVSASPSDSPKRRGGKSPK